MHTWVSSGGNQRSGLFTGYFDGGNQGLEFDAQAMGDSRRGVQPGDAIAILDEADGLFVEPGEPCQPVDAQALAHAFDFEGFPDGEGKPQMGIVWGGWGWGRRHPLVIDFLESRVLRYKSRADFEVPPGVPIATCSQC